MYQTFFNKRIKASGKLYLLVLVLSVFIIGLGAYGIHQMKKMKQQIQTLYEDRLLPMQELTQMRNSYTVGIISSTEQAYAYQIIIPDALARIKEAQSIVDSNWKAYMHTNMTPEEYRIVEETSVLMRHSDEIVAKVQLQLRTGDMKALNKTINHDLYPTFYKVVAQINKLLNIQVSIGQSVYAKSSEVYDHAHKQFIFLILLSLAFALPLSFLLVRNVKELIRNLRFTNERIATSEKKYRDIFENVQDVFYQTSLDGTIIEVSPSIKTYTGYSREELIGTSAADMYYNKATRDVALQVLLEQKELVDFEFRLKSKTDEPVYASLNGRIIMTDDGNSISHIDGVFRNITERKKSEEKLRNSESKLREAQSIAHLGYWEVDLINHIDVWSEELYTILGTTEAETKPSKGALLSFIHPDDVSVEEAKMNKTFITRHNAHSNFRFIRKDKSIGYAYVEWAFEFDADKRPIRLHGIFQDITERKKSAIEKEKMALEIMQRNKTFEEFSFIVSHNLRSPVSSILGISALLKSNPSEEERMELERYLFESVEKLDDIIRVLNDVLKVRTHIAESRENIQLDVLVKDIKNGVLHNMSNEAVHITTDFVAINTLFSVKSSIQSIFYNLLSNSIKFRQCDKEAMIHITTKLVNDRVKISFKDNGRGIDLDKFGQRLFNLYERFHLDTEGKGIGLFMVKTQVEMLGGTIGVQSEPDKGTEFLIELPVN